MVDITSFPSTPPSRPSDLSHPNATLGNFQKTESVENPLSAIYSFGPDEFGYPTGYCDGRKDIWETNKEKIASLISEFEGKLQITDGTCSTCQNIFDQWQTCVDRWPRKTTFPHHDNLHFLESSSRNGCRLCRLFVQSFDNRGNRDQFEQRKLLGIQTSSRNGNIARLRVKIECRDPKDPLTDCWNVMSRVPLLPKRIRSTHTQDSKEFYGVVTGRFAEEPFKLNPVSHSDLEAAISERYSSVLLSTQLWLNTCLKSHERCKAANNRVKTVPTRLIFIGNERITLWQRPESFKTRLKYATLSHCWGGLDILRLKKHNLADFEKDIPHSALCKTFQDAIHISKWLNIQYLWIDSLCIIQDDEEDWEKESALMSDVYSGSYLNIAAASASDGREGCFFVPTQDLILRHQLNATLDGKPRIFDLVDIKLYDRVILDEPLANRAWVYQERALAPRVLYFSRHQVFWECEEEDHCEVWPSAVPWIHYGYTARTKSKFKWDNSWDTGWGLIMEGYSKCQMSLSKDKLVALSGVVQNLQRASGDEYLAGMWRKDLEWQLTWFTSKYSNCVAKRPPIYRAPTWTWTSLDGQVSPASHPTSGSRICIQVLDVQIQLKGLNPFGEVSRATLTLNCEYLLEIVKNDRDWYSRIGGIRIFTCHVGWAYWDCEDIPIRCFLLPTIESKEQGIASTGGSLHPFLSGLILEQAKEYGGIYKRVGHFKVYKICNIEGYNALRKATNECKNLATAWSGAQGGDKMTQEGDRQVIHIC